jgi:hypothetical protein
MRILGCIAALVVAWPNMSAAAPVRDIINPNKADWEFKPSAEMVSAAYPPFALALDLEASTLMQCGFDRLGVLHDCSVVEVKGPKDVGFEAASLKLAPLFRLRPDRAASGKGRSGVARFPLSFRMPPLKNDFPSLSRPPRPIWSRSHAYGCPSTGAASGSTRSSSTPTSNWWRPTPPTSNPRSERR